ncbi:hypothetical protein AB1Y20_006488 [Prymnesium parvum]|uniref:CRAL-TRIO domain-containing protein n=1 Tax=Prymnesium parvum TaxID=97485 RepID=A0AB34J1T5_PRYPA
MARCLRCFEPPAAPLSLEPEIQTPPYTPRPSSKFISHRRVQSARNDKMIWVTHSYSASAKLHTGRLRSKTAGSPPIFQSSPQLQPTPGRRDSNSTFTSRASSIEDAAEISPGGTRIRRRSSEAPARLEQQSSSKLIECSGSERSGLPPLATALSRCASKSEDLPHMHRSFTAPNLSSLDHRGGIEIIYGPHNFNSASVSLEQHPRLAIATLHSVTNKNKISEEDLNRILEMGEGLIQLNCPFTVMHDLRQMSIPTRKQMRIVLDWLACHRHQLDVLIQGIVVILSNPAVRAVVNFLLGVIKPPQPILIVKDEHAALKFLSENCQVVQLWREIYEARKKKGRNSSSSIPSSPVLQRVSTQTFDELGIYDSSEETNSPVSANSSCAGTPNRVCRWSMS